MPNNALMNSPVYTYDDKTIYLALYCGPMLIDIGDASSGATRRTVEIGRISVHYYHDITIRL